HRWLWQTNVLLCVLFAFSLFKNIFKRFVGDYDLTTWVRIGMVSLLLGFLCWLLLKIMLHPGLFRGIASTDKPLPAANHGGAAAGAGNGQRTARLREHMETERPYLEPTLTVKDLADQLAWPERELSVLINQELGRHFFDFVNDYRIEHAKTLLRDPANARMTVLEILYAVGFNSKSSFNVAFKNRTGKTPTQYRKSTDNQPLAKSRTPVGQ
ncbi:MAG: helix-turn-helix transcriptional regulator, partial [Bacteroidota bacterium]